MRFLFFLFYLNFFYTIEIKNYINLAINNSKVKLIKEFGSKNKFFFKNYALLTASILFSQKNFLKKFFGKFGETRQSLLEIENFQSKDLKEKEEILNKIPFDKETKFYKKINAELNIGERNVNEGINIDQESKKDFPDDKTSKLTFKEKLEKIFDIKIEQKENQKKINENTLKSLIKDSIEKYYNFFIIDPIEIFTKYSKEDLYLTKDQNSINKIFYLKNILNKFDKNNKTIKIYKNFIESLEKKINKENFYNYLLNLKNQKNFSNIDLFFSTILGTIGSSILEKKNKNLPFYLPLISMPLFSFLRFAKKELFPKNILTSTENKTYNEIENFKKNPPDINFNEKIYLDKNSKKFLSKQLNSLKLALNNEDIFSEGKKNMILNIIFINTNINNNINIEYYYYSIFSLVYTIQNLKKLKIENKSELEAKLETINNINEIKLENFEKIKLFFIKKYISKLKQ